ncbi:hypothetical protein BD779DRAFT_1465163 [Infundibulicybe gibba]|nr:hypothetical protein BD779DRAFT_1465163 [Infundibulicybe gibba]
MHNQPPYIPLELIQVIAEQLADSKPALRACALVCNAWLPISFRVLFHRYAIRVYAMSPDELDKLRAGLMFPHYVSYLTIRNSPGKGISSATLGGILSLFDRATRISITHYELDPYLNILHQTHPHLRELEVISVLPTNSHSLQAFIAGFSHLERLSISHFTFGIRHEARDNYHPSNLPPPSRLSSFAYKSNDVHRPPFLRWLSEHQPTIKHLTLLSLSIGELEPTAVLLRALGPYLHRLDISFKGAHAHEPGGPTRLPLQANTHLHTLCISYILWHFPALSPPLEPGDTSNGQPDSLKWDEFDAMLAQRAPALECLHVHLIDKRLYEHSPFMRVVLGKRMPWCSQRGVLRGMDVATNHRELGAPLHERLPLAIPLGHNYSTL